MTWVKEDLMGTLALLCPVLYLTIQASVRISGVKKYIEVLKGLSGEEVTVNNLIFCFVLCTFNVIRST